MQYLVFQQKGGKPVGVLTETDSYFDPTFPKEQAEDLVDFAHNTRGVLRPWSDWVESLVEKTPGREGYWNAVDRRQQSLPRLLEGLQASVRK